MGKQGPAIYLILAAVVAILTGSIWGLSVITSNHNKELQEYRQEIDLRIRLLERTAEALARHTPMRDNSGGQAFHQSMKESK